MKIGIESLQFPRANGKADVMLQVLADEIAGETATVGLVVDYLREPFLAVLPGTVEQGGGVGGQVGAGPTGKDHR